MVRRLPPAALRCRNLAQLCAGGLGRSAAWSGRAAKTLTWTAMQPNTRSSSWDGSSGPRAKVRTHTHTLKQYIYQTFYDVFNVVDEFTTTSVPKTGNQASALGALSSGDHQQREGHRLFRCVTSTHKTFFVIFHIYSIINRAKIHFFFHVLLAVPFEKFQPSQTRSRPRLVVFILVADADKTDLTFLSSSVVQDCFLV